MGLHLVYRYLQTSIITPPAFNLLTDGETASSSQAPLKRQHHLLVGLARVLYFVVTNKTFPEPIQHSLFPTGTTQLGARINPLIKVWHTRFKDYILDIVDSTSSFGVDGVMNERTATKKWTETVPGLKVDSVEGVTAGLRETEEDDRGGTLSIVVEVIHTT